MRRVQDTEIPSVQVRVSPAIYKELKRIALKHEVTMREAMDLLIERMRMEAEEAAEEYKRRVEELEAELAELKKRYKAVKKERDDYKKELDELDQVLQELTGEKTAHGKQSGTCKKASRSK